MMSMWLKIVNEGAVVSQSKDLPQCSYRIFMDKYFKFHSVMLNIHIRCLYKTQCYFTVHVDRFHFNFA